MNFTKFCKIQNIYTNNTWRTFTGVTHIIIIAQHNTNTCRDTLDSLSCKKSDNFTKFCKNQMNFTKFCKNQTIYSGGTLRGVKTQHNNHTTHHK